MSIPVVSTIDPLAEPRWDELVTRSPYGALFSSRAWMASLADGFGLQPQAVVSRAPSGELVAAVPYCRLVDAAGERLRVLPFSDYCDPLVDDAGLGALTVPLLQLGLPMTMRVLHHRGARSLGQGDGDRAAWHEVELTSGAEAVLAKVRGTARRNASRAARLGVEVRVSDTLEAVRAFHRMHAHLRKHKYRMLAQPQSFFDALHRHFAPAGDLAVLTAELDGEPVAAILALFWSDTMYYKFNASYDTAARPNDLLMCRAIELGAARGCRALDLGLSALEQPGLIGFKEKFATRRSMISTTVVGPTRSVSTTADAFRAVLSDMVGLLTDPEVPDDVCRRAGERFYRCFA